MKHILLYLFTSIPLLSLFGCGGQGNIDDPPAPVDDERTIIVYMVANNNLSAYAISNINAMESAFSDQYGGRLLLFYNDMQGNCRLYDIVHDEDSKTVASEVIKEYPYKTNPCLPETLADVVADCRAYSDTPSYSMIFWSHGTGWLPQGMTPAKVIERENPDDSNVSQSAPQYTFGASNSFYEQLEIYDLADALPTDIVFDYIHFDACLMAGVELAYELRDNAKYVMASSAEILAEGFPYQTGLRYILTGDVKGMAKCFYDYYNAKSGVYRSATISVVDCAKLPAVAAEMRELVELGGSITTSQQFGRNLGRNANFTNLFWDLGEMAELTWGEQADDFLALLDDAVVYKATTPMLFEGDYYGEVVVNSFSGLTVYRPRLSQPLTLDIYRENYAWARDTQLELLAE